MNTHTPKIHEGEKIYTYIHKERKGREISIGMCDARYASRAAKEKVGHFTDTSPRVLSDIYISIREIYYIFLCIIILFF